MSISCQARTRVPCPLQAEWVMLDARMLATRRPARCAEHARRARERGHGLRPITPGERRSGTLDTARPWL